MGRVWTYLVVGLPIVAVGCTVSTGPTPSPSYGTLPPDETPTPTPTPDVSQTPTLTPTPTPTATEGEETPTGEPTVGPDPTPVTYWFEATVRGGDDRLIGKANYILDRSSEGVEEIDGYTELDYAEVVGIPFSAMTHTTAVIGAQGRLVEATIEQIISVGASSFDRKFWVDAENRVVQVYRDGYSIEWVLPQDSDPIVPWTWESDPFLGFKVPDVGMAYIAATIKESSRQDPLVVVPDFFSTDESITGNGPCYTLQEPFCLSRDSDDGFIESVSLGDVDGSLDRVRFQVDVDPISLPDATENLNLRSCLLPDSVTVIPIRLSENRGGEPTLAVEYDLPLGDGPFPTVLLVADIGGDDRDWAKAGTPVARCLALSFLDAGIAVVRYDDRGHGESGGAISDTSFVNRTDDVYDVYADMVTSGHVQPDKIVVIAHGVGAAHVADAITDQGMQVAGIVAVGTYTGKGDSVWLDRSETWLNNIDMPSDFEDAVLLSKSDAMDAILSGRYVDETFEGLSIDYWEDYWTRDINGSWAGISSSVYILHGQLDWEVSPVHSTALSAILNEGGNDQVLLHQYENFGHRMSVTVGTENLGREYYLPFPWDPTIESDLLLWVGGVLD